MTSIIFSNSLKQKQQQKEILNNKNIQKRLYRESFEQPSLPPAPPPRNYFSESLLKKHQKEIETQDISMEEIIVPQKNDKLSQELLINIDNEQQMEIIDECENRKATECNEENDLNTQQVVEEVEEVEEEEINVQDIENDFIRYQSSMNQNETDSDSDDSESEDEDYSNDDSSDSDYNVDNSNNFSGINESAIKRTSNGRYIFDNNSYFYQRQHQQPKQYHIYADNSLRMELIEIITFMKNNEREKPNVEEVFVHEIIL